MDAESNMMCERKKQAQRENSSTTQLGMVGLYGTIKKQSTRSNENRNQDMDLTINNKPARALVYIDTRATHSFVIEAAKKNVGLNLTLINSHVKTVNAEAT